MHNNKVGKLRKMDTFLKTYNLLKLNRKESENLEGQ